MKRILVFLLAATMVLGMLAICSSANDLNEYVEYRDEYGEIIPFTKADGTVVDANNPQEGKVPKIVGYTVNVDGVKEGFYDQGLVANIGNLFGNKEAPVSGTAYFVYDDNNLYLFVECNDNDFFNIMDYVTICPECGKQRGKDSKCAHMGDEYDKRPDGGVVNVWDDDCIEFLIDWSNDGSTPSQYRISRSGIMSRDYDTFNTGFSGKGYDVNGTTWGAEYSIPLDSSAIGTQLGVHIMIHSQNSLNPYNETYAAISNFNATGSDAWSSDYYDYIELYEPLKEIDTDTKPPVVPTTSGPSGDDPTVPTGSGNTTPSGSGTTTPSGNGPVNPRPNPTTADPIVYIILVAVVSLGAAVVVKKTCFNK